MADTKLANNLLNSYTKYSLSALDAFGEPISISYKNNVGSMYQGITYFKANDPNFYEFRSNAFNSTPNPEVDNKTLPYSILNYTFSMDLLTGKFVAKMRENNEVFTSKEDIEKAYKEFTGSNEYTDFVKRFNSDPYISEVDKSTFKQFETMMTQTDFQNRIINEQQRSLLKKITNNEKLDENETKAFEYGCVIAVDREGKQSLIMGNATCFHTCPNQYDAVRINQCGRELAANVLGNNTSNKENMEAEDLKFVDGIVDSLRNNSQLSEHDKFLKNEAFKYEQLSGENQDKVRIAKIENAKAELKQARNIEKIKIREFYVQELSNKVKEANFLTRWYHEKQYKKEVDAVENDKKVFENQSKKIMENRINNSASVIKAKQDIEEFKDQFPSGMIVNIDAHKEYARLKHNLVEALTSTEIHAKNIDGLGAKVTIYESVLNNITNEERKGEYKLGIIDSEKNCIDNIEKQAMNDSQNKIFGGVNVYQLGHLENEFNNSQKTLDAAMSENKRDQNEVEKQIQNINDISKKYAEKKVEVNSDILNPADYINSEQNPQPLQPNSIKSEEGVPLFINSNKPTSEPYPPKIVVDATTEQNDKHNNEQNVTNTNKL